MTERLFLRLEEDALHGPESSAPPGTLTALSVPAALAPFLLHALHYREEFPGDDGAAERVVPDGLVRLVFDLAGPSPRATAIGASVSATVVRMRGRMDGISLGLRAGAASQVLGVPAGQLAGTVVSLQELWGAEADALLERLFLATDEARSGILQDALRHRLRSVNQAPSIAATRAASLLALAGGRTPVSHLAADLGVGERRLQQLFQVHVGLSPKAWSRLARMHACLRTLRRTPAPDWAEVAVAHGFYDQAHLVNEFRSICGLSPTAFLERTGSGSSKTGGRAPR